jgi:hypothetical protein
MNNFIVFFICIIIKVTVCDGKNANIVFQLDIENKEINNVLDSLIARQENIDNKKIAVMRFEKLNGDTTELRVALLSKNDFKCCLLDKRDVLYGFIEYKSFLCLVYGIDSRYYFQKNKEFKKMNFLNNKSKKRKKKGINYPPINFEPTVFLYHNFDGKFILKKSGYLEIIK